MACPRPRPLLLPLLLILPAPVLSGQEAPKPVQFTGDVGLVNAAGNTEVTTINVADRLLLRSGRLLFTQSFGLIYGRSDGEQNANSQQARIRAEYPAGARIATYAFVGYERDRFAGIARRVEEGIGFTWSALASDRHELQLEGGFGFVQERKYLSPDESMTESGQFATGRTAFRYRYRFTKTAYFQESFEFIPDLRTGQNHRVTSETMLVAPISSHFALKASYQIKYNKTPPSADLVKTDRLLTTGLQVSW